MSKKHVTTYAELVEALELAKYELYMCEPCMHDSTLLLEVLGKINKVLENTKGRKQNGV